MTYAVLSEIEKCFLPLPQSVSIDKGEKFYETPLSTKEKVAYFAKNFFKFFPLIAALPFAMGYSLIQRGIRWGCGGEKPFQEPALKELGKLPQYVGFADSLFQTSGLGTRVSPNEFKGEADWDDWLTPEHIEGGEKDYTEFFCNILDNPDRYIEILKSQNVSAHRFSLEWSIIQPERGRWDEVALESYRKFIGKLKKANIEPFVTLHHFVCPKWFKESGGFDRWGNIEVFKDYALKIIEEFPEVKYWIPFNEINIDGFQKCVRGVYPPGEVGNIAKAGRMMRNMLIAHTKIYREATGKKIFSSHQWLKFKPLNGNFLEKIICYYLSKITHFACLEFFKTGTFSLQIPFKANIQLRVEGKLADAIGVQYYGFPRIKAGFSRSEYPGYRVKNWLLPWIGMGLSFGASCQKGEKVQSFGPKVDTEESFEECLEEAASLKLPIYVTEFGCDASMMGHGEKDFSIDREGQKAYFEKAMRVFRKYNPEGIFVWTLGDQLEWERGDAAHLPVGEFIVDRDRNVEGYRPFLAADYLQRAFGEEKEEELRNPAQNVG